MNQPDSSRRCAAGRYERSWTSVVSPSSNAYSKFGTYSWWIKRGKQELLAETAGGQTAA
jgi:hypothetical protein